MTILTAKSVFRRQIYLVAFFSFLLLISLIWACKSSDSSGCSNGSDCDVLAGNTYTSSVTLGAVTTNVSLTFNDDGTVDVSITYSGTGAPTDCGWSGEWSLNGKALAMTTTSSSCSGSNLYFQYVYELDKNYGNFQLKSRWLSGSVISGNKLWKQDPTPGFAGSYNAENFAQETTVDLTAGADSAHGTFQWAGDYTQSGTWQADYYGYLDVGTCNFTGTAGPDINTNTTYSLTMNVASAEYTKQ